MFLITELLAPGRPIWALVSGRSHQLGLSRAPLWSYFILGPMSLHFSRMSRSHPRSFPVTLFLAHALICIHVRFSCLPLRPRSFPVPAAHAPLFHLHALEPAVAKYVGVVGGSYYNIQINPLQHKSKTDKTFRIYNWNTINVCNITIQFKTFRHNTCNMQKKVKWNTWGMRLKHLQKCLYKK